MKHVTIIAAPKALGSTVTIPLEMLSAANDIARARRQLDNRHYRTRLGSKQQAGDSQRWTEYQLSENTGKYKQERPHLYTWYLGQP